MGRIHAVQAHQEEDRHGAFQVHGQVHGHGHHVYIQTLLMEGHVRGHGDGQRGLRLHAHMAVACLWARRESHQEGHQGRGHGDQGHDDDHGYGFHVAGLLEVHGVVLGHGENHDLDGGRGLEVQQMRRVEEHHGGHDGEDGGHDGEDGGRGGRGGRERHDDQKEAC